MRKVFGILLIVLVLTGLGLIGTMPYTLPPFVERFASGKIAALGFQPDVRFRLNGRWRGGPGFDGDLRLAFAGTPWGLQAKLSLSPRGWTVFAEMPETSFTQDDPTLRELVRRHPVQAVSNLTFSGSVGLNARVRGTFLRPVPVWDVKVPLRNLSARFFSGNKAVSIDGLSLTPAVSGIDTHSDIHPAFVKIRAITADHIVLSNLFASVHASERTLLLTEASAGFCGGKVCLYSLVLDMKRLSTGFTLFADDIDAGEALRHFNGFRGNASGRLHGKIRLFVKEGGRAIRLNDAFLYSTPGETGKIQLHDAEAVTQNLAYAGLDASARANVADVLTDLDYTALKMTLQRQGGENATLTTHISGTATRGKLTVPVNLTLNLHGDVEQLINLGLDYNNKLKGKKP